jgi:hypothetical protein
MFSQGTQHSRQMLVRELSQQVEMIEWAGDRPTLEKRRALLVRLMDALRDELDRAVHFAEPMEGQVLGGTA